jgi:endonuclease YncB( thermonuclease family)
LCGKHIRVVFQSFRMAGEIAALHTTAWRGSVALFGRAGGAHESGMNSRICPPRRTAALSALLACLLAYGLFLVPAHAKSQRGLSGEKTGDVAPAEIVGRVDRIVDGDTMRVVGQARDLRLWGIDTPERGQPGFWAAGAWLEANALGREVRCIVKQRADRYGRPVGQCFVGGRDLGAGLVGAGLARDYPRFSRGYYAPSEECAAGRSC